MKIKFTVRKTLSNKTPQEIIHSYKDHSYLIWLDSSMVEEKLGRYSIIGVEPLLIIKGTYLNPNIQDPHNIFDDNLKNLTTNKTLSYILDRLEVSNDFDIPFQAGLLGYFGYEYMHYNDNKSSIDTPDSFWMLPQKVYIYDHINNGNYECTINKPYKPLKLLNKPRPNTKELKTVNELTFEKYKKKIEVIKKNIFDGNIYECCFTHKINIDNLKNPLELYLQLRKDNPSPFAAYLKFNDMHILCCSPERFLKTNGNDIEMRPIKGTMKRGVNDIEDKILEEKLRNSIKNQAENIMIVDLIRNDLGRVCNFNSIKVEELFKIEKYTSVFQMVSTISGKLLTGKNIFDVLKASFPGGSMTGAPKIRAMEYIKELEVVKRGIYSGAIGYLNSDLNSDLNIVIRTIVHDENKKKACIQIGGAIVHDSSIKEEYDESLIKAEKLLSVVNKRASSE